MQKKHDYDRPDLVAEVPLQRTKSALSFVQNVIHKNDPTVSALSLAAIKREKNKQLNEEEPVYHQYEGGDPFFNIQEQMGMRPNTSCDDFRKDESDME